MHYLDAAELAMLLDGIDYQRVKRKNHWQAKKSSEGGSTNDA